MTDLSDDRWDVVFTESMRSPTVLFSVRDRLTDRVRKGRSSDIHWLSHDIRRTKEAMLREQEQAACAALMQELGVGVAA